MSTPKYFLFFLLGLVLLSSCDDDDPMMGGDNPDEEEISRVVLTFTPDNGEDPVVATWFDADGEGEGNPTIDEIELEEEVNYTLTIAVANTLGEEEEDVAAEILKEDHEHMFFFSFTEGFFTTPTGDGNVDDRKDAVVYNDMDENDLPVGLSTSWTTGEHSETAGEFTIILKHQPEGLKTADSDTKIGGTDIDITFPLEIVEEGHEHNDDEEVINEVILTFTPTAGGTPVVAKWFDADGEGVGNPTIDNINLAANTEYDMTITLANTLGAEVEDVTAEVLKEDFEHMFFFEFTDGIFSTPSGDGNVDNRAHPLVYNDKDKNDLPVGLSTKWTTGGATAGASFRVVLKHQPEMLKTATSDANTGGTDVNVSFVLSIQ